MREGEEDYTMAVVCCFQEQCSSICTGNWIGLETVAFIAVVLFPASCTITLSMYARGENHNTRFTTLALKAETARTAVPSALCGGGACNSSSNINACLISFAESQQSAMTVMVSALFHYNPILYTQSRN